MLLALLVAAGGFLVEAHLEMRRIDPPLPDPEELVALASVADGPVRLRYVNTASQAGGEPATVAHPSFWLEWTDGRGFLIDAGMEPAAAREFGRLTQTFFGSDPIEVHGSVTDQLGSAGSDVRAIAFTHLHTDHTNGIVRLCELLDHPLRVFQTPWQADRENYTTSPGRAHIEATGCARLERLGGGPLHSVPGFPGLAALAAAGHTPGSTVYVAHVAGTTWVFAGDVTNFMVSLRENRPKPLVYSLLIVPENRPRLERMRLWLDALAERPGFRVVVSHDLDAIQASGMAAWRP